MGLHQRITISMKSFFARYFDDLKTLPKSDIESLVSKKISQDYADLETIIRKNALRTRVEDTLSRPDSWKWVLGFFLSISILLFGGSAFFTYLHQNYDIHWCFSWQPISLLTAQSLIDQRISNVATIIGLSLTVSTFLVNNLAEKESNYHLLFKTVFIYPIIYYALGLMIWLEAISILKESFSVYNSYLFVNAVSFTHFLIALLLVSIAYLFSQLIPLLNPEFLYQKTIEDFTKNTHIILLDGIKTKEKDLIDDNLYGKEYKWANSTTVESSSRYISNYDSHNKTIERQTEKIRSAIEKKDLKALQKGLEFYKIGYEVFCTHMKGNNIFRYRFDDPSIIKQREYLLSEILRLSIEQKKNQLFDEVLYFVSGCLARSRYSDNQIVFYQLIYVIKSTFKYINPQYQSHYLSEILKLIDRKLTPFFSPTNNIKPEIDNNYQLQCYTLLLTLIQATLKHLYNSSETKSLEGFQAAMTVLNDTNQDLYRKHFDTEHALWDLSRNIKLSENEREKTQKELKEKMRLYDASRHASLAVKSWLFYIYQCGCIDGQLLKNAIGSVRYQFDDSQTLLSDYCTILKADRDYLGFDDWDFRERISSSRITISAAIGPNDWLPYGLLAETLLHDLDENADYSTIETYIQWQFIDADWPFNLMIDKQEEWLEILEIDAELYEKRKTTFRNIIERLARQEKLKELRDIASQPFDNSKIENFKNENFKSWKHHASILSIFEHFGNKIIRPISDTSLKHYPFSHSYPKSAFVEQKYSVFMERGNFGGSVGDYFNLSFLELIDKEKKDQILNFQTVVEAYASVSKLLISKGFKPNLIIAPIGFIY